MLFITRPAVIIFLLSFHVSIGLELKFLNIIFRHGDRTPSEDPFESFPTSPYVNSTFWPHGIGQLNNRGKLREYELGAYIRQQYNEFLGKIYHSHEIITHSSDFDRIKMSLQLVLAGMYPPVPEQRWHPTLNWQPIVCDYLRRDEDFLLFAIDCPKHTKEFEAVLALPEVQAEVAKLSGLAKNVSEWIGRPISTTREFLSLYNGLASFQAMELELPKWTSGIFPNGSLLDVATLHYRLMSYNDRLKALNGGMILKNFTDNMLAKINGDGPPDVKMVIVSGHETHIALLQLALGVYDNHHVPQYSSAIFVELLEEMSKYYVRIYYYLGIPPVRKRIMIPRCDEPCPLEKFVELYGNVLTTDSDMTCERPKKP
ncbi:venom acid phosphatase Acph-1 [Diachasma alloeum]|uniref:venom acid phosphatase Acph-1 n=1 Tax=Diachasma alloeum TaxID=454923 RepID=UPI00073844DC|nr:venom acid phosphatase Acph-1 [Diachasma alloeum]